MEKINNKINVPMSGIKKYFHDLFNDENKINEKSVIGFASFCVMVMFAIADIITGALGKDLIVNEFIFNSFLIMTLGSLGIGSVDKYINNKKTNTTSED